MAITISGENNNDKILASDGVIDQLSGFSIVGVVTATSFTGDLTGNVTGNLTGNVNSTSPLLLQTGGSERFRITGNNELGIAGANYGSSGQVLTSGGSGSAVSWTTIPTQVSISNNADNRIITGGSGTNLVGESTLTYDGSLLSVSGNLILHSGGATRTLQMGPSSAGIEYNVNGTTTLQGRTDAYPLAFKTQSVERLRIMSGGKIKLGSGGDVVGSANVEIRYDDPVLLIRDTAESSADGDAKIAFGNNTHYPTAYISHTWDGNDGSLTFHTRVGGSEAERLRVKSDGTVSYRTGGGKGYEFNSSGSSASVAANVFAPASYTLAFGTNGNERLRINSTGDIGINYSGTPNATLDIRTDRDPSNGVMCFLRNNTNDGNGALYGMDINGCGTWSCGMLDNSNNFSIVDGLGNSGTEYFRIDSGGSVSIGDAATHTYSAHSEGDDLVVGGAGWRGLTIYGEGGGGVIQFADNADNRVGQILYNHGDNSMNFRTAGNVNRLKIHSNGDITIGNNHDTATQKVDILNGSDEENIVIIRGADATTEYAAIGVNAGHAIITGGSSGSNNVGIIFRTADGGSETQRLRLTNDGVLHVGNDSVSNTIPSGGLDLQGNQTNCVLEMGNPFPGYSGGIVPEFRITTVDSSHTVEFRSVWGGTNLLYKHMSMSGGATMFYDGINTENEVMRITGSSTMFGTTSSSANTQAKGIALNDDGSIVSRRDGVMHYYKSIATGGYYANVFMSANTTVGSIFFNSGGTQFNTSSDYRRKENIVSLTDGITKLKQLKPYRFNFKDNPSVTVDGFLAHEAQEIVPHTVTGTKDQVSTADDVTVGIATTTGEPIYQQMDLSKLVPLLTAALQEEIVKREALEVRVSALEGS